MNFDMFSESEFLLLNKWFKKLANYINWVQIDTI